MSWLDLAISAEPHVTVADSLWYVKIYILIIKILLHLNNSLTIFKWKHNLTIIFTVIDHWLKVLLIIFNLIEWHTLFALRFPIIRYTNRHKTSTWLWSCKSFKGHFLLLWSCVILLWWTSFWKHVLNWHSAMKIFLLTFKCCFKYLFIFKSKVFI